MNTLKGGAVLVVAPLGKNAELAAAALQRENIQAEPLRSVAEACHRLDATTHAIILAEEAVTAAEVELLLQRLDEQPPWSDVPLIILTSRGGEEASRKVLSIFGRRANVTLLERPLHPVTLLSATRAALRARSRQFELRDVLEQREMLVTSISDAFSALDNDFRYTFVNDKVVELAGRPREEIVGRLIWEVFPQAFDTQLQELCVRARDTKQPQHAEFFYTPWGRWLDTRVYPTRDGIVILRADVSELHAQRERLEALEQRTRLAIEAADAGVFDFDPKKQTLTWSERCNELFGLPEGTQPSYSTYFEGIHPDDRGFIEKTASPIIQPETGGRYEIEYRTAQTHRWLNEKGRVVFDQTGEAVRILGAIVDVTLRKQAEEALAESERRFRTMADAMPQLAWVAHADGYIYWYNRRWYEYTGTTAEEMAGWGWQSVHDPATLPAVVRQWQHSLATGEPFEMVFPLRGADGLFRRFLTRVRPLRDSEGRVTQWFGTNTDVDELKQTQDALQKANREAEEANQAKDRFLAMISHELRTPLAPVLMTVAAIQHEPGLSDSIRADIESIRRNIELEALLIDDLLDLTRTAHGKLELQSDATDVHALLEHAVSISMPDAAAKRVAIRRNFAATEYHCWGDAARLEQVFWNVLKNGVKFTPAGGEIVVATRNEADHQIVVEISDNGVGIAPEILPRIFDAFEQGGRTVTSQYGGLGLGLAISKSIIDHHGGTIEAASSGSDKGATFTIRLLAMATSLLNEPVYDAPRPDSPAGDRCILIVEDHADTARVLRRMLEKSGFRVSAAGDLRSARQLAAQRNFDLVISDMSLPDGSGLELMRELHQGKGLRGIALSGFGTAEDAAASRAAGFVEHLIKPVDWNRLREAIDRAAPATHNGAAA